jgi:putative transposase
MSRIIIGIGTKFFYNKCGYEIIRSNGESKFVCKNLQFEVEEELTIDQMLEYANQNQLIFKNLGVKVNEIELKDDFAGYEEDEINEANYRYHCIEPLLKNKPEVTMKERIAQLREEGIEVSKTRMYEWLSSYVNGGYDRRFLVSKRNQKGGKEKPRTVERVNILLGEIIEKHYKIVHPKRPPALYKLLKARIHHENIARESNGQELLKCPSKRTIFRRISRLDRYETAKAQYGPLYVYTTQGFVQAMERPTRPLQFVQFDSTSIDLIFVHDDNRVVLKRATFTAAIDVFSRVIIGFNIGFKKPGYESTIMQKNIKEKYPFLKNEWPTYGLPENIILDNGPEFKNRNLALACEQLGINIVFCKVKQPWTKGIIERFLQTFNYQLNHILPGTTFANPKTKKNSIWSCFIFG